MGGIAKTRSKTSEAPKKALVRKNIAKKKKALQKTDVFVKAEPKLIQEWDKKIEILTHDGKKYRGLIRSKATSLVVHTDEGIVRLSKWQIKSMKAIVTDEEKILKAKVEKTDDVLLKNVLKKAQDPVRAVIERMKDSDVILSGEQHAHSNMEVFWNNPSLLKALKDNNFAVALEFKPHWRSSKGRKLGVVLKEWNEAIREKNKGVKKDIKEFSELIHLLQGVNGSRAVENRHYQNSYPQFFKGAWEHGLEIHAIDDSVKVKENFEKGFTRDKVMADNVQALLKSGKKVLFMGGNAHAKVLGYDNKYMPQYPGGSNLGITFDFIIPLITIKEYPMVISEEKELLGERMTSYLSKKYKRNASDKVLSLYFAPGPSSTKRDKDESFSLWRLVFGGEASPKLIDLFTKTLGSRNSAMAFDLYDPEVLRYAERERKSKFSFESLMINDARPKNVNGVPNNDLAIIIPAP